MAHNASIQFLKKNYTCHLTYSKSISAKEMKKIGSEHAQKNLQQNIDPKELVAPDSEQPSRAAR